jgi:integrase
LAKKPVKQDGAAERANGLQPLPRMPTLERIRYTPHRCGVIDITVQWTPVGNGRVLHPLTQIVWSDGAPWREANLWALERATSIDVSLSTVESNMRAMHRFAKWLELSGTGWWEFPPRKADRCLVRFRGHLIEAREAHEIAPSTASQTMTAVVQFYRWLHASGLISPEGQMWREKIVGIHLIDPVGFNRTILVNSTDLAIRNRKAPGERLEDGLLPVSAAHRTGILEFVKDNGSEELFLMLSLGFFTGMRLGTLADLRIQTLDRAVPDPASADLFRVAVGPGADPPVHTKGAVTGHIHITGIHLDELRRYYYCTRRLKRQTKAAPQHRDLVFLTKSGKPYAQRASDYCAAINVEMHKLRKLAAAAGQDSMRHFKFHQSRCTFATELARLAISASGAVNVSAPISN